MHELSKTANKLGKVLLWKFLKHCLVHALSTQLCSLCYISCETFMAMLVVLECSIRVTQYK